MGVSTQSTWGSSANCNLKSASLIGPDAEVLHERAAKEGESPVWRRVLPGLVAEESNSNHVNCNQSNRLNTVSYCTYHKILFNIEVISNYSNKNFYSYYAVIPRGTISLYQLRIIFLYFINNKINFYPKKRITVLL